MHAFFLDFNSIILACLNAFSLKLLSNCFYLIFHVNRFVFLHNTIQIIFIVRARMYSNEMNKFSMKSLIVIMLYIEEVTALVCLSAKNIPKFMEYLIFL